MAENKNTQAVLDFTPYLSLEELITELKRRFYQEGTDKDCEEALIGFFPKKLIPVFLKECEIEIHKNAGLLTEWKLKKLAEEIKYMHITITGTKGFEHAQVCAGGVNTEEINPETLESKLVTGLYFAGEVIDIDGICGGYNLQWAWASGYVAGLHGAE